MNKQQPSLLTADIDSFLDHLMKRAALVRTIPPTNMHKQALSFSDVLSNTGQFMSKNPMLSGAAIGGGLGGLGGMLWDRRREDEDRNPWQAGMTGALAGAALGGGIGAVGQGLSHTLKPKPGDTMQRQLQHIDDLKSRLGNSWWESGLYNTLAAPFEAPAASAAGVGLGGAYLADRYSKPGSLKLPSFLPRVGGREIKMPSWFGRKITTDTPHQLVFEKGMDELKDGKLIPAEAWQKMRNDPQMKQKVWDAFRQGKTQGVTTTSYPDDAKLRQSAADLAKKIRDGKTNRRGAARAAAQLPDALPRATHTTFSFTPATGQSAMQAGIEKIRNGVGREGELRRGFLFRNSGVRPTGTKASITRGVGGLAASVAAPLLVSLLADRMIDRHQAGSDLNELVNKLQQQAQAHVR